MNKFDPSGHIAANVIGAVIGAVIGTVGGYFLTRYVANKAGGAKSTCDQNMVEQFFQSFSYC